MFLSAMTCKKKNRREEEFCERKQNLSSLLSLRRRHYKGGRDGPMGTRRGSKRVRWSPAGSAVTLFTLSIKGALRSLHLTCLSVFPLSTSFIMLAQSGRFLGLDFNASNFCIWSSLRSGRSLRIVLLGGGGGGRGGGGGGMFARDELFDKVGAPWYIRKSLFSTIKNVINNKKGRKQ